MRALLIYDVSNLSLDSSIRLELFSKLACFSALDMRRLSFGEINLIEEIAENVGKLIHLKHLNLSDLDIKELPETSCGLYNLHKLDIRGFRSL